MNTTKKELQKEFISLSLPIFVTLLLNYGFCNIDLFSINTNALYFSIFVIYLVFIFLTSLVKKTHLSTYILSILILIFSVINNIKLAYLDEPIYTTDIYFLNNISDLTNLVKSNLTYNIDYIQIIILFTLLFCLCFVSKKNSITINKTNLRLITGLISISLIIFIFSDIQIKNNFLLNNLYKINNRKDYSAITTTKSYYIQYGAIAGMYGLHLEDNNSIPEEYNKDDVIQLLQSFETSESQNNLEIKNKVLPNIIVMFQESYWDIELLEEIEFDKQITQNINELKKKGEYVKMLSPSYGGVSSNIIFELLTGGNLAYFRNGYDTYSQLYRKHSNIVKPSLVYELKNNRYKTKVVHGFDYYESKNIYNKMFFDNYTNVMKEKESYEYKTKGYFVSDESLTDDVLFYLKNKDVNERIFYMTATIQSHMPYYKENYDKYDIDIVSSKFSEYENGVLLSYAQGVYDTNIQIKRLYDEIQNLEEPTIIIFLGDHLPYLPNEKGEDILQKTTYFNTGNKKQDLLRKYATDILILSNYDDNIIINTEYISPDLLLTIVLNNLNIKLSPFYKYLYTTRNILPAQNQYLLIDGDSNIYYKEETLPKNVEDVRKLRKNLQYYLFKDTSN